MNPGRYFMPSMAINPTMIRNGYTVTRGMGLFGRLFQGLRTFNWSNLLSGANKTLNVMNQTIPLVRQAKPVVNNVKNMLNLAKAFRNETINNIPHNNGNINNMVIDKNDKLISIEKVTTTGNNNSDMPAFFIEKTSIN